MSEERTNFAIEFGANYVLELASFRMSIVVADRERVGEQSLGQAMAPDNILRAAIARIGQAHLGCADFNQR
jgi:hypothetical protein